MVLCKISLTVVAGGPRLRDLQLTLHGQRVANDMYDCIWVSAVTFMVVSWVRYDC
jgi:hypothetical protein